MFFSRPKTPDIQYGIWTICQRAQSSRLDFVLEMDRCENDCNNHPKYRSFPLEFGWFVSASVVFLTDWKNSPVWTWLNSIIITMSGSFKCVNFADDGEPLMIFSVEQKIRERCRIVDYRADSDQKMFVVVAESKVQFLNTFAEWFVGRITRRSI